jgi:hypothetical protein
MKIDFDEKTVEHDGTLGEIVKTLQAIEPIDWVKYSVIVNPNSGEKKTYHTVRSPFQPSLDTLYRILLIKTSLIISTFNTQLETDGYVVYPYLSGFFSHSTNDKAAFVLCRQIDYSNESEKLQKNGTIQVEILTKLNTYSDDDGTNNATNSEMMDDLESSIQSIDFPITNGSTLHGADIQTIATGVEQSTGHLRADAFLTIYWSE